MLFFFFFNDTATTEIYTLSLHDALPISQAAARLKIEERKQGKDAHYFVAIEGDIGDFRKLGATANDLDRKSTRLNSSHVRISYAVFCLKKKNIRSTAKTHHVACRLVECT